MIVIVLQSMNQTICHSVHSVAQYRDKIDWNLFCVIASGTK